MICIIGVSHLTQNLSLLLLNRFVLLYGIEVTDQSISLLTTLNNVINKTGYKFLMYQITVLLRISDRRRCAKFEKNTYTPMHPILQTFTAECIFLKCFELLLDQELISSFFLCFLLGGGVIS